MLKDSIQISQRRQLNIANMRDFNKKTPWTRVFKACESCRQRKVKCDGARPCHSCIKHSTPCIFRKSARRQLGNSKQVLPAAQSVEESISPDSDSCTSQSTRSWNAQQRSDLRYVLRAPKTSEGRSGRGKITRIFGPTSPVAVLNLILDLIAESYGSHHHNLTEGSPIRQHIDVQEYLRQAFATNDVLCSPSLNLSPPGPLDTVPVQVQSLLLERYIKTSWKILPFQSPDSLRSCLSRLSYQPISQDEDKARRSIMFPLLAIGSITTGHGNIGEMFIREAQRNKATPLYMGDILALQSDMLMISDFSFFNCWATKLTAAIHAQYHTDCGSFEVAWIQLGEIFAKFLAAGMDSPTRSAQEQAIISAFCCTESLLCIALGRKAVFSSNLKHLPKSDKTIIGFMHPFFRILADIQSLYQQQNLDFIELWSALRSLHQRLENFWLMEDPSQVAPEGDEPNMGTVLFQYSLIVLYRPFLLIKAMESLRNIKSGSSLHYTSEGSETAAIISAACEYAIRAATKTINFFSRLYKTSLIQKSLPLNAFFLENACYALLIDSLWGDRMSLHSSLIHACVHAMEQTQEQKFTSTRLPVIKQVLQKAGIIQNPDELLPNFILLQSGVPWMNQFLDNQYGFL
ncbi:hypothetical protein BO83DRAFT_418739 [Aspergillus eucalypticola CBS 122712]|uniref:Zn(2)-C6 fungal-type domain-containing protein n=1 Tax=Aspergillus eucalypticola (strain CBS 122712 / IBT 29274) TaxID=1448314 RepID=A0A317VA53_ASPEC|nr:uncharacterized protein BO83DRAFT_418739 [Aspergillus eucalypticola CBS 122712]PWY68870.1 hypothetical protein BO83DRAFT_418739 [Aspergillus eucalypticola CBS 122712]